MTAPSHSSKTPAPMVDVSLRGRTAVVTGANTGIGFVTARELAQAGARVLLACRSESKAQEAMARLRQTNPAANLGFLNLDVGSLASTRRAAEELLKRETSLHFLINNAGLAGTEGRTEDGFEVHFGTNHLGPYLFTRLLLPLLTQTQGARIVNVASQAHFMARRSDWAAVREPTKSTKGTREYALSKLCNIAFTSSLASKQGAHGVPTYSLHPGAVASDIYRHVPQPLRWVMMQFMISNDEGARTQLHCATSPAVAQETGLYYDKCKPKTPSALARDQAFAEEIWSRSAEWTGLSASLS